MVRLDRYVPTPHEDVAGMLSGLRPADAYCDLGSGDGRLLLAARAASVVGYELNAELARKSRERDVTVIEADFMEADWSVFDYLTFFGDECWSDLIRDKFDREARPGARLKLYREAIRVQP